MAHAPTFWVIVGSSLASIVIGAGAEGGDEWFQMVPVPFPALD